MDLGLEDRVYVVTGGARGLGRATADALVADGARVVLSGRSEESLDAARAELGDGVVTVVADNGDAGTPGRLVAAAQDARMLVVGTRGLGMFRAAVLGSTSRYCATHATCPVVVVPSPEGGPA